MKLDIISQKKLNDSISKVVQEVRPEIVFIPFSGDINKDNKLVAESALVAVRPRPDSPVKKVFCYEVLSETGWSNPAQDAGNIFTPNYYENISDFLDDKKIKYEFNKVVRTKTSFKFPDFQIGNLIIECDGVYWHKQRKDDKQRENELKECGFEIIRFTDTQINKNFEEVKECILQKLNQLKE